MNDKKIKPRKRSLENEINQISRMFFLAREVDEFEKLSDIDAVDEKERYVSRVRAAFDSLKEEEKEMINNEFFYENYPFWWVNKYSRSAFYRLRNRSMFNFKKAFENAI